MPVAVLTTTILLTLLGVFQIVLALGAPIGKFAWGGTYRVLPGRLRVSSLVAVLIYMFIVTCLLSKSNTYELIPNGTFLEIAVWSIFAYFILGIFVNAISRSKKERYTMTPITVILAVCTLTIALT